MITAIIKNTLKLISLGALLIGCISCSTTSNSIWNNLSQPFQPIKTQPSVPELQLNFTLPDDFKHEPIKFKSMGVTDNCDLSGTCSNKPN